MIKKQGIEMKSVRANVRTALLGPDPFLLQEGLLETST
jgi:hypothetical protein